MAEQTVDEEVEAVAEGEGAEVPSASRKKLILLGAGGHPRSCCSACGGYLYFNGTIARLLGHKTEARAAAAQAARVLRSPRLPRQSQHGRTQGELPQAHRQPADREAGGHAAAAGGAAAHHRQLPDLPARAAGRGSARLGRHLSPARGVAQRASTRSRRSRSTTCCSRRCWFNNAGARGGGEMAEDKTEADDAAPRASPTAAPETAARPPARNRFSIRTRSTVSSASAKATGRARTPPASAPSSIPLSSPTSACRCSRWCSTASCA